MDGTVAEHVVFHTMARGEREEAGLGFSSVVVSSGAKRCQTFRLVTG